METLADLVSAGRDRAGTALTAPGRATDYSYREFATDAWKSGNLLRHYGVRPGSTVAVVVGPKDPGDGDTPGRLGDGADPLLAFLGGALTGATVDLSPESPVEASALVAPDAWQDRYEVPPGCTRLAYGGPPEAPAVAHFERERWSENPTEPPETVSPGDPALRSAEVTTHGELLTAGREVVDRWRLSEGEVVVLDAPLGTVEAVVAGIVAPLSVGATVSVGADGSDDPVYTVSDGGGGTVVESGDFNR